MINSPPSGAESVWLLRAALGSGMRIVGLPGGRYFTNIEVVKAIKLATSILERTQS